MSLEDYYKAFGKFPSSEVIYSRTGKQVQLSKVNPYTAIVLYPSGVVSRLPWHKLRILITRDGIAC